MKSIRSFIVLLVSIASASAIIYLARIHFRDGIAPPLHVRAVAHQWWWEFDYPTLDIRTSNVLRLPSNTNIRLELVSGDVIHSFWIEGMRNSIEIIPDKTVRLDLKVASPGELYGNCDSGCGCGTVCMRFRVLASTPLGFKQWVDRAQMRRSDFKPPRAAYAPACALNGGHTALGERHSGATRLQHLLDEGIPDT
jgi:cytochrome c oxidase subunit II